MAQQTEQKYAQLAESLRRGELQNFYFLWGEESYLIEKAVQSIGKICLETGCEGVDSIESEWNEKTMEPDLLKEWVSTPPFLSKRRLVLLRNSGIMNGKIAEKPLEGYLKVFANLPESVCLILVEEKVDKRKKKLYEQIQQLSYVVNVPRQSAEDLCKWVGALFRRAELRVTIDAVNSLVDRVEGDMRLLENEVKKVILFCQYRKMTAVTITEIEEVCIPDLRGSVFQMTDAIGQRNTAVALHIAERLIAMKEPVTRIRFMLARHLKQLLCAKEAVKSAELASRLKIPPFAAQKLMKQASSFKMEELKDFYLTCAHSDYQVKTGAMEELLSLQLLLCSADHRIGYHTKNHKIPV